MRAYCSQLGSLAASQVGYSSVVPQYTLEATLISQLIDTFKMKCVSIRVVLVHTTRVPRLNLNKCERTRVTPSP